MEATDPGRNQGKGRESRTEWNNPWGDKHRKPTDFKSARPGDGLFVPFECDYCIFHKLRGTDPKLNSPTDDMLMAHIRRANLDSFWSRASSTVKGSVSGVNRQLVFSKSLGLSGPYQHWGPLPDFDHCGYEVAIGMLMYSRQPGRYQKSHCQFDTIRKLRSVYSNFIRASTQANRVTYALCDSKGKYQRFNTDVCSSLWFERFQEGLKKRMGQDWRPNKAFTTELLHRLFEKTEEKIKLATNSESRHDWTIVCTYMCVLYVGSLRGSEGTLLDLAGLIKHNGRSNIKRGYCVITLLGKVKGEHQDRVHMIPCVLVTKSGLKVHDILSRLIELKIGHGFDTGPAISDSRGRMFTTREMDGFLHSILEELYEEEVSLFPKTINSSEDISKWYQSYRSFRRTSNSTATEAGVCDEDKRLVNRWRQIEKAGGNKPTFTMPDHYTDITLIKAPFLRYTGAL